MFELDIHREFSAAHSLRGYNGDCSRLHGHNWTVQVFIRSEKLDEVGIAMDFKLLKKDLDAVLAELDHQNLAVYIYNRLKPGISRPGLGLQLSKGRVCESASSGASYFE